MSDTKVRTISVGEPREPKDNEILCTFEIMLSPDDTEAWDLIAQLISRRLSPKSVQALKAQVAAHFAELGSKHA